MPGKVTIKKRITKDRSSMIKRKSLLTKAYMTQLLRCDEQCIITDITKDGKLIRTNRSYLINYQWILYLLNNIYAYSYVMFPMMYGRNEQDIVDKLSILYQCIMENVIFYIPQVDDKRKITIEDIYKPDSIVDIVLLKHSNVENFTKIYFYGECEQGKIADFKINPLDIVEKISYLYFTTSLLTYEKPTDINISIRLFYQNYIKMIAPEILETYNIDIKDPNMIANYEKLYLLLNKLGYVRKFFTQIYPKCKKSAGKIEKKITSHPKYIEYLKYFHSYKPFADKILYDVAEIDVKRLVMTRVGDHLDKEWILSEYEKLKANGNFGIRM